MKNLMARIGAVQKLLVERRQTDVSLTLRLNSLKSGLKCNLSLRKPRQLGRPGDSGLKCQPSLCNASLHPMGCSARVA